jgi:7,8-dihydroneopterin aldolase/epimerase/oxygenase
MTDAIRVVGAPFSCVIGVYEEERHTPQPLLLDFAFFLDSRRAAVSEDLAHTVDYARVLGEAAFVLGQGRFLLLETAAEVLTATLLSGLDVCSEMELTIHKPRALQGAGEPALTVRRRHEVNAVWSFPFGAVEATWKGKELGVYRLRLRPGCSVKLPKGVVAYAADQGRRGVALGPMGQIDNAADGLATYLLCSRPPVPLDAFAARA